MWIKDIAARFAGRAFGWGDGGEGGEVGAADGGGCFGVGDAEGGEGGAGAGEDRSGHGESAGGFELLEPGVYVLACDG